jgi:hypothetical protein
MFDDLEFTTVVQKRNMGDAYFKFKQNGKSIRLMMSVKAVNLANSIVDGYNHIELMVSGDSVIAIKPKIKPKSKNNKFFTATGLKGKIKDLPFDKRMPVVLYKDMIVCDLRK